MAAFRLNDPNAIGVAVLGAGRMGLTHIRTLAGVPSARVIAIACTRSGRESRPVKLADVVA